ncbi:MAG: ATP-binding protein, partial [Fibrobacterota bacterium]
MNFDGSILRPLASNLGLVSVLALACSGIPVCEGGRYRRPFQILLGLLFGCVAVLCMLFPVQVSPGVILDGKTIVAPLAALFYGPIVGGVAAIVAIGYRIHVGGIGVLPAVVLLLAGFVLGSGLFEVCRRKRISRSWRLLAGFGIAVAATALLTTFLLPWDVVKRVVPSIWGPVLALYPLGIVVVGLLFEIIESRKRILEELQIELAGVAGRQQFIESVVDLSPDLLYIYDIVQRRNIYSNQGIAKILGYSPQAILEMGSSVLPTLMHPDDFKTYVDEIYPRYATLRSGEHLVHRYRMKHMDGNWRWLDSNEIIYNRFVDGKPAQIFGMVHDVTEQVRSEIELARYREHLEELVRDRTDALELEVEERKKVQNALQEAKDASESANQAKSAFLANMSHELRTPLNAILGFAQILSREVGLDAAQHEKLAIIVHAGDHLLSIINDILDLAKIESGKIAMEPAEFDIGALVHDLVALLRVRAETKGLDLVFDQSSSFPRFVRADPDKLRQILVNLVGNAIKFTRQGSVVVKLVAQNLGEDPARQRLHFEITDTGAGIRQEDLERIFEPFVQLQQREGTGLGLTITRQFIRLMGGELRVESEPGKGSVFRFAIDCERVGLENLTGSSVAHGKVRSI